MHHGMCVKHVPWCMSGSLTSGFLWRQWRGKCSRYSRRMRNPQFTYLERGPCWYPIWNELQWLDLSIGYQGISNTIIRECDMPALWRHLEILHTHTHNTHTHEWCHLFCPDLSTFTGVPGRWMERVFFVGVSQAWGVAMSKLRRFIRVVIRDDVMSSETASLNGGVSR